MFYNCRKNATRITFVLGRHGDLVEVNHGRPSSGSTEVASPQQPAERAPQAGPSAAAVDSMDTDAPEAGVEAAAVESMDVDVPEAWAASVVIDSIDIAVSKRLNKY